MAASADVWTCENGRKTVLHAVAYDVCQAPLSFLAVSMGCGAASSGLFQLLCVWHREAGPATASHSITWWELLPTAAEGTFQQTMLVIFASAWACQEFLEAGHIHVIPSRTTQESCPVAGVTFFNKHLGCWAPA